MLAIVLGKPMYNHNRLPYHDRANRSRALKTSTFTQPLGISHFYRSEGLTLTHSVTAN
jgi:hypothetical protein